MKKEESIPISKFKAKALGLMDRVARTGRSITVTKRGKPLVRVVPTAAGSDKPVLGSLAHTVIYMGDVVSPAVSADEWEANR